MRAFVAGVAALALGVVVPARAEAPQSGASALSTYGQLPGFEMGAMSSTGDHVAIIATVEGVRRLLVLDSAKKVVASAKIGDVKVRDIDWAGDQFVLIHYSQTIRLGADYTTKKAEAGGVLVVPLDGSKAWEVFAGEPGITSIIYGTYGVLQRDGRWYGYFAGDGVLAANSDEGYPGVDLYEVDLQTHKHRVIAKHPGREAEEAHRDWLLDGTGTVGASLDIYDRTGDWTVHNARGVALASGKDLQGRVELIGFTPDGTPGGPGVIYSLIDAEGGLVHWFSVPLAGGASVPYLDGEGVKRVFEDRAHHLLGYTTDAAGDESHLLDARQEKIYKASQRAFPGLHMELIDHNDAFDRLLVTTTGPGDPITWWQVDIKTGKADELGQSYPMDEDDVGPMKMVPYAAADGLKMEGVLTLPPARFLQGRPAKALPAVVLPHGGPFGAHDTAGFDWLAQAFASRGYVVFQPNFRGSGGYGQPFERAGYGEYGRKMQTDISDGLAELVRQGVVDPKRVCIMGWAYGGYAALAGVTVQQGLYRCAVSTAGISDLNDMVNGDLAKTNGDVMLYRNIKQEIGVGQHLTEVSPIRFVDKVAVPVLLIHGKDDTVVEYSQSSRMADALRHAGKVVEFVTLPGEDHWLSKSETRLAMLQASMDFVMKHNPPDAGK